MLCGGANCKFQYNKDLTVSSVSELSNPINLFRISELMGFNNINAIVRVRVTNPTIKDMFLM